MFLWICWKLFENSGISCKSKVRSFHSSLKNFTEFKFFSKKSSDCTFRHAERCFDNNVEKWLKGGEKVLFNFSKDLWTLEYFGKKTTNSSANNFYARMQKLSTQSPKTKKKLEKITKKLTDCLSGHYYCSFDNPDKTSIFLKRPSRTNLKSVKILSLHFFWRNFFLSVQLFGHIECSFGIVADQFLPNYWKFYVLKIRKVLWVF